MHRRSASSVNAPFLETAVSNLKEKVSSISSELSLTRFSTCSGTVRSARHESRSHQALQFKVTDARRTSNRRITNKTVARNPAITTRTKCDKRNHTASALKKEKKKKNDKKKKKRDDFSRSARNVPSQISFVLISTGARAGISTHRGPENERPRDAGAKRSGTSTLRARARLGNTYVVALFLGQDCAGAARLCVVQYTIAPRSRLSLRALALSASITAARTLGELSPGREPESRGARICRGKYARLHRHASA